MDTKNQNNSPLAIKTSENGNGKGHYSPPVKSKPLTVEEELEAARKQAEENAIRIANLEKEKQQRDKEEADRLAKEKAEATERMQFQAFKQFLANVTPQSMQVPASTTTVVPEEPIKAVKPEPVKEAVSYSYDACDETSGGLLGSDTNRLIKTMGGTAVVLVLLYMAILSLFGKANDSVSLMFDSFPLRMYINLLIEVVAIGIGFLGLRLLFPEQYKYVHSKINSLCSPKTDWERASPEFRLRFASEQLWRFAFLFVLALMVIFT